MALPARGCALAGLSIVVGVVGEQVESLLLLLEVEGLLLGLQVKGLLLLLSQ